MDSSNSVNSAMAARGPAGQEVREGPGCTTAASRSFATTVRGWLYQ